MTDTVIQEPVVITDTSANQPIINSEPVAPSVETASTIETATTSNVTEAPKTESKTESVADIQSDNYWKDDWKQQIIKELGEDGSKIAKDLDKYKTPAEMAKANRELLKKFSSTRPLPELPENATPEQIKEYRELAGIPNEAKEYDLGLEIPESYKEDIQQYLEIAHKNNRPVNLLKAAIGDYLKLEEVRSQQLTNKILENQANSEKQLKESWGPLYENNKAVIKGFFDKTFGEETESILNAYLPDGTRIGDNAKVMSKLLDVSKNTIGASTIISNNLTNDVIDLEKRLSQLNNMALNSNSAYWGANHAQFKADRENLSRQLDDIKKNRR